MHLLFVLIKRAMNSVEPLTHNTSVMLWHQSTQMLQNNNLCFDRNILVQLDLVFNPLRRLSDQHMPGVSLRFVGVVRVQNEILAVFGRV